MDIKDIEQAYAKMSQGKPKYILCPEGAFLSKEDGTVEVWDFDSDGNHYLLPLQEQEQRKDTLRKRLGI